MDPRAVLVFVSLLVALFWAFRIVLEHNKWNSLSKVQTDLYSKLLDKCSTNEELLAFFRTAAGKPFFDLAAIEPRTANPLNRIFLPLQFGIVLFFAGGGLRFLRHGVTSEGDTHKVVILGTLLLTLGIGLIISAAVAYWLARHLGLLPQSTKARETGASD